VETEPTFSKEQLDAMLLAADADAVRIVKSLEIDPSAIISKQYDR
jgi:hypothetical protein